MSDLPTVRDYWDAASSGFDAEADHGLGDPAVRQAWADCLSRWLPTPPADVLDAGCGTGSLSRLLAGAGHHVVGVDVSARMIERARAKCPAPACRFVVGDAADPPVAGSRFDVVLSRHLLWTLPDPAGVLRRWTQRLRPGGRLVLVEGRWGHGAAPPEPYADTDAALPWLGGVGADTLGEAVRPLVAGLAVEPLPDPRLWGQRIDDERYALVATL